MGSVCACDLSSSQDRYLTIQELMNSGRTKLDYSRKIDYLYVCMYRGRYSVL